MEVESEGSMGREVVVVWASHCLGGREREARWEARRVEVGREGGGGGGGGGGGRGSTPPRGCWSPRVNREVTWVQGG